MKWIPVSERLPIEDVGTVAVLTAKGDVLTAWATYWHGASNDFAQWSFPHEEDADSEVTHWCELPRLPRQKESGS